jgi:hypothetical protein
VGFADWDGHVCYSSRRALVGGTTLWITDEVAMVKPADIWCSMVMAPDDTPHMAIVSDLEGVFYASKVQSAWATQRVDTVAAHGGFYNLAMLPSGVPVLVTTRFSGNDIVMKRLLSGNWDTQLSSAGGVHSWDQDLVFDSKGGLHLLLITAGNDLVWACRAPLRITSTTPYSAARWRLDWAGETNGVWVSHAASLTTGTWTDVSGPLTGNAWTGSVSSGFFRLERR